MRILAWLSAAISCFVLLGVGQTTTDELTLLVRADGLVLLGIFFLLAARKDRD